MSRTPTTCLIISDSNMDNLAGLLTNGPGTPAVRASAAPFGQVMQILIDPAQPCWSPRPDAAVVWTQPHGVLESFRSRLAGQSVPVETVLDEVDAYAASILRAAERANCLFVPTWVVPPYSSEPHLLEFQHDGGTTALLMRMNLRLAERLSGAANVHILNAQRWVEQAGKRAFNPKLWYMAKVAFGPEVFQEAAQGIKAALAGVRGEARKLIVLDLDDTLWGGVVGDLGWERLTLGGHDPAGEAFADFQRALKTLAQRGILLALVSKNDEAVALEAVRRHPEMVLTTDDLAGWKINWNDKAANVAELASELNLGLQSVVFIDNHPVERARVREAFPEVLVPEWPDDPMLYPKALQSLACFNTASVSREDQARTRMYVTERQRTGLKREAGSVDEWLRTLGITVTFEPLTGANRMRAAQLLNKTNQMNLSTRRMSETELAAWAEAPKHAVWTVHVSDKFGDSGLTGLVSVEANGTQGRLVDFVLSCRVMGRKVEEAMLAAAVRHAKSLGLARLSARCLPTPKNKPCAEFFQRSGFRMNGEAHQYEWNTREEYPAPAQVTIHG